MQEQLSESDTPSAESIAAAALRANIELTDKDVDALRSGERVGIADKMIRSGCSGTKVIDFGGGVGLYVGWDNGPYINICKEIPPN